MTESGDPKDNAVAERLNSTIKNELFKDIKFHSIEEVKRAMAKAVEFYNNERPHMSLDNMTPHQAASYKGKINKKWISYREKYLQNLEFQAGATNGIQLNAGFNAAFNYNQCLSIFIQQSLGIRRKSFNQPQAYSTNPFNFF